MTWRAIAGLLPAFAACSSPTASCAGGDGLAGRWEYHATQDAPIPGGTLNGSLVITAQGCTDFQGALDVVEVLATGETRRIAGPVSGTLLDATVARFEVTLAGTTREHLARLRGDSLGGSWVESSGALQGSGSFGGRRQ